MATLKDNRASGCETNPFFLELFRDLSNPGERERAWHTAMVHAGEGTPPLRFPVYETLYLINIHAQKLVDLLEDLSRRFGVDHESLKYHQSLIQYVRAVASQSIAAHMNDIETTEEWLFERQRMNEENKLRDPEDADLEMRHREAERAEEGLPPGVQLLDEPLPEKPPTEKEGRTGKTT
jgi:hypothetical protein